MSKEDAKKQAKIKIGKDFFNRIALGLPVDDLLKNYDKEVKKYENSYLS